MSKSDYIYLSEFELLQKVHSDPHNEIYKVRSTKSESIYSAKVSLEPLYIKTNRGTCSILKEANMLAKMNHPSILRYIGFSQNSFDKKSTPVLILEFCKNGSLESILEKQKKSQNAQLNDTQNLNIIFGIASAMNYMHSNKIIYRNLSTSKILLDDNFNPKISGMGLAIKNDDAKSILGIEGNPIYIAPEIWEKGEYSEFSDVYAFSIVVYQILTGIKPFEKMKVYEIQQAVSEEKRPDLASCEIPEAYKNLIQTCWSQDPKKRPSFEQIISKLKTEQGFINEKVDKKIYSKYIDFIEKYKCEFNPEKYVIQIKDEISTRPIDPQIMNSFKKNPQNIKYFVIQEAMQELKQVSAHYNYFHNFDINFDNNKLKNEFCVRYIKLSNANPNDPNTQKTLEEIRNRIDDKYSNFIHQSNKKHLIEISKQVLKKVLDVLYDAQKSQKSDKNFNIQELQVQINKILDDYPEKVIFNKDKLKEIASSSTSLNEMLCSLESIRRILFNNKDEFEQNSSIPNISVLYSPKEKKSYYSTSLSNVLQGDCFFITLFGNSLCTRNILSYMSNFQLEEHKIDDVITIYGPVKFESFGKTVTNSIQKLKDFNEDTNLYFIEISNEYQDQLYNEWCEFFSFISHIMIFCSDENPDEKQIANFEKFLLKPYTRASIISCSPLSVNLGKNPVCNFDINNLNDNLLHSYLFETIYSMKLQFIPSQTVSTYSYNIMTKKMKGQLQISKSEMIKTKIENYSYKRHNEAIEYSDNQRTKIEKQLFKLIDSDKYYESFHLSEHLNNLIDLSLEHFYISIYPEIWNENEIEKASIDIKNDVSSQFDWITKQYGKFELIGKLIFILQTEMSKSSYSEAKSLLDQVKKSDKRFAKDTISKNLNPESNAELVNKLKIYYKEKGKYTFSESRFKEKSQVLINELRNFLLDNPIASDDEYGKLYSHIIAKNSSDDMYLSKLIYLLSNERPISEEYLPKKYYVTVDKKSFESYGIEIQDEKKEFNIANGTTCKELYNMIRESYNLSNTAFYITRSVTIDGGNFEDVEVFDDDANIAQLNVYLLTIHCGINIYTSKTAIESLIIEKTINIADDFIIKTNSKNADYHVTFPADHNGWIDVPFNITNDSQTSATDKALVYLKMNANDITYLQQGNSLTHQYLQGNEWVDDPEPVFLSYPNCDEAVIYLTHCSEHRITKDETKINNLIPSEKQNTQFSSDWQGEDPNIRYSRGGRPYYLPVGHKSIGIRVNNFIERSCVAFHGTTAKRAKLILNSRFKKPSEIGGVRKDHIELGINCYNIENFADAVFVSPSIKYASIYGAKEVKARGPDGKKYVQSGNIENRLLRILILQVRVIPNSFTINENTTDLRINDPHYPEDQMEWRIADPSNLFPYRLLFKHVEL